MSAQPEAMRLAAQLEGLPGYPIADMWARDGDKLAAAELHRLHKVNAELLEALELFLAHSSEPECAIWRYVHGVARAAIANAKQNDVLVAALADMGRAAL